MIVSNMFFWLIFVLSGLRTTNQYGLVSITREGHKFNQFCGLRPLCLPERSWKKRIHISIHPQCPPTNQKCSNSINDLEPKKRHWQAELVSSSPVRWRLSGFYVSIKKSIVCHYLILNNKENIQTPRHTTTSPLKFHPTICPCQLNPPSILGNSGVATKRKPGWVPATDAPLKIAWLPSLQKKMGKRFVSCHRFD